MMSAEMIDDLLEDARERMDKSVESTQHEFSTVRTGRASPSLLDRVVVDYYGALTPLNQLATISAPEARLITVQPYDKSSIKAIEKAINESDLGLNPSNDGNLIRLVVPELTEERRRELVKVVRNLAEEGRVAIRNIRRDVMQRPARAEGRGRGRLRRRAPRRGRAAEADRRAHRRARRRPEGQGRGDPRGLMGTARHRGSQESRAGWACPGRRASPAASGAPAEGSGRVGLRRDHHRRQRALGARARRAGQRRPQRRRRHRQGAPARRRRAGRPGADRLLVLDRELVAARRRGAGADGDVRRADRRRDPRAARGGRADALHRPPRGRLGAARRADGLGRSADRRQRAHHAVRRVQLRRARRDPRRRARASSGGDEEEFRELPVRAGDARPGPDHPHQRRAAAVQLPALAVGLLGAGLPRRAVAGLHARGARESLAEFAERRRRFGGR